MTAPSALDNSFPHRQKGLPINALALLSFFDAFKSAGFSGLSGWKNS